MYLHFSTLISGVALINLLVLLVSNTRNCFHVSLICFDFGTSINMLNLSGDFEAFATTELMPTGSIASGKQTVSISECEEHINQRRAEYMKQMLNIK